jgi:hypothetical protein
VIEGSDLRSGARVRITAQLIRAVTDQHLWAESYERDFRDIFSLQGEIARQVAAGQDRSDPRRKFQPGVHPPSEPGSSQAVFEGSHYWNKRTEENVKKAFGYVRQAIDLNPTYAEGYLGLSDSYNILGY